MAKFFSWQEIFPPFGLSDNSAVLLNPKELIPASSTRRQILVRGKRQSKKDSLSWYFATLNLPLLLDQKDWESMSLIFDEIFKIGMNNITYKDVPWIRGGSTAETDRINLGGSGGMPLGKILKKRTLKTAFAAIWALNFVNKYIKKTKPPPFSSGLGTGNGGV